MCLPSSVEVDGESARLLLCEQLARLDPAPNGALDNSELLGRLLRRHCPSHCENLRRLFGVEFSAPIYRRMLWSAPDRQLRTLARPMPRRLVVNGKKARQLRTKKARLTQQVAAVRVDVSVSTLRRIENGSASVQLGTLGKIADLYGVNP